MRNVWIVLGVMVLMVAIGFGWFKGGYNRAVALDEQVKAQWSQVENQLQRRNDLIPNVVNTVKGFAAQEKEVFTEVTRLRSQWGKAQSVNDKVETANQMGGALSRLLLVSENYPELKSNQNFLNLQAQLEGTENRISVERMRYNESVNQFNRFQRTFFGRFFASAAGVTEPAVYFKAQSGAEAVPEVVF